jgi:6-phosphofructokinase
MLCHAVPQGTSRGGANIKEIVRRIDLWGLDMVFVVGGNGGNAAADAIQREVEKQGVRCVVAGVPKSIDNDILLVGGSVDEGFVGPVLCMCMFVCN